MSQWIHVRSDAASAFEALRQINNETDEEYGVPFKAPDDLVIVPAPEVEDDQIEEAVYDLYSDDIEHQGQEGDGIGFKWGPAGACRINGVWHIFGWSQV